MKKDKWIWMPHAGHFILAGKCKFTLNTYVGTYIVSTVGELWPERGVREIHAQVYDPQWLTKNKQFMGDNFDSVYFKRFGYEDVGCDRKFETMVFKAKKSKDECCPYEIIVSKNKDVGAYNTPGEAYRGHLRLCDKWSKL